MLLCFINPEAKAQDAGIFVTNPGWFVYSDTSINKREVLAKLGIKEIKIYKNAPQGKRKAIIINRKLINSDGRMVSTTLYIHRPNTDTIQVITDSFIYNTQQKEKIQLLFINPDGTSYGSFKTKWINDSVAQTIYTGLVGNLSNRESQQVTLLDLYYYNNKGQLIKSVIGGNEDSSIIILYKYNEEGLLDTEITNYNSPGIEIQKTVYQRFERDGLKIVQIISNRCIYKWIYNEAGQCIQYIAFRHKYAKDDVSAIYSYNKDGTLSDIKVKKGENALEKYYYSYSK